MSLRRIIILIGVCVVTVGAQTIYQITSTNQTYNYTTNDYYGSPGSLPGVAFRFTAPAAGAYTIVVEDVETTSKYILEYGTDQTFNDASIQDVVGPSTATLSMTFTASAGQMLYFSVYISSSSYTNNFRIRYAAALTLTVTNDGNGTTSPSGATAVASGIAQSISASPTTGYRFNNWTVTSGNATFADATSYSTTVTITANATVRANFSVGTVYQITAANQQYNYTTHYYQGSSPSTLPGVAFRFTAPVAGSYAIIVEDVETSYKYLYDYGTSSTFSSYSTYIYGSGTLTLLFTASSAGEIHYFGVRTSSSSYYTNNFRIRYESALTLTVTNDGNGTTSPSGATAVTSGVAQSISATPNTGYRFNNWTVTSGNATFADATSYSTNVTITNNATIRANFSQGTIYPITATDVNYNYTTHYYTGSTPSWGVAFSFTAPAAGSYAVVVGAAQSFTKYLYYYGTTSGFGSTVSTTSGSGEISLTFTAAAANEVHYFRVPPASSSYYTYDFIIRYTTTPTLTITNDGNGTTSPSGATAVASGVARSISASPNTGYRFDNWTITSGSATIADPNSYSTTATITADATIRANFKQGTIYPITATDVTYNYTTHYYYGTSPGSFGVAFSFTAPAAGSYAVVVGAALSFTKYLYYYSTDATFGSYVNYTSGSGDITITFTAAAANEVHYFRVPPYSSSYYTYDFTIRYATTPTLTVTNDGNGTTSPSGDVAVVSGVARSISATANTGYRFNNWTVTNGSGNATIADATSYSTTVTLTGNATIQANFSTGSIYQITNSNQTYNYTTHYYTGTTPGTLPGVAFRFTAPAAGSYAIVVEDVETSYKYLYDYGTNSTFSSYTTYSYGSGTLTIVFTASTAGETHYFGVRPSSTSYYSNNFTIRYETTPTLTITNDGNGTTSPSGAVAVVSGVPFSIYASPNSGYRFKNWTLESGSATFGDPNLYSTTVTTNGDATIKANFSTGTIYPITNTEVTYNYTTHYFRGTSPGSMPGVAFRFTAPAAGTYAIVVNDVQASSKYLFDYLTDQTFNSYNTYTSGTGTLTMSFSATAAGEIHYFSVMPSVSNYYSNDFTIRWGQQVTLNVTNNGNGTTSPNGSVTVWEGAKQSLTATPSSGYYFLRWERVSGGTAIFDDPDLSSTNVRISGSTNIRAVFATIAYDTLILTSDGNGTTDPLDTIILYANRDTLVAAIPAGGHIFTNWSVVSGTATIANPNNAITNISGHKATIQASFHVDPNARPIINISSIDISGHPDICVTASVIDTAGRSITGLDSSYFTLMEDGTSLPFQLTTVTNVGGTSVTLVIDTSGSMSGTPVQEAITAAQAYINSMTQLDRCAIVAFADGPRVVQTMTSDKAVLNAAVSSLTGSGGTSILSGANLGVAQLLQETNSRTVIIFSDGSGTGSPPLDSVINFARHNNVTIYSIGIGSATTEPLKSLADSTGGTFTTAPSASELAAIYAQIKRQLNAQYILCYQTPDQVFNGDTHSVVISVSMNNHTDRDTTYWDESNRPPVITLTAATQAMLGVSQSVNTAISITADVTDDGSVSTVRLFYRRSGSGSAYTDVAMTLQSGSTYQAIIPAGAVQTPGIDFYILATDNHNLLGRSPNVINPATQPWVIPVNNDAPQIVHKVPDCIPVPADTYIDATITDADGIASATLFYKRTTDALYTSVAMTAISANNYRATIPASGFSSVGADYYLQATDNIGVVGRDPQTGFHTVLLCDNQIPILDVIADTTVDEGELLLVRVTAVDPDGGIPRISASGYPSEALFIDSGNGIGLFTWDIGCNGHGVYSIVFQASDGIDSVQATLTLTARDLNFAPELSVNDTTAPENDQFTLTIRTDDCDGDIPTIRAISIPSGSSFHDNGDGTATLEWLPECDENGYYILVFEAADDHTAVRDTMLLRITDVNCFTPEMTLSSVDLSTGINLPASISIHATDGDGTVPGLEADNLPSGAVFTPDGNGNAVFTWTPANTGTFTPTFSAVDAVDPAVRLDTTVTITVTDDNITGPAFLPCPDTIIDENQLLTLTITAKDPDGTIPTLSRLLLPAEARFIDNGDGSAGITWQPGCATHGNHLVSATATDGVFSDTLTVLITVRDCNCPPLINPIADKSITYGSTIRFTVSATDPDNDVVPELSVSCALSGYSFTVGDSGSGTFEWNATVASGSYPVTFYANDGFLSDTEIVVISVDKAGSLHIVAEPSGTALYISPAAGSQGTLLGTGSASFTHVPGTYWFRAQAPGYRPSIFTGTITADETCTLSVTLKSTIPLMVAPADSARIGSDGNVSLSGSIAFVDFDADGIQDLSVADGNTLRIFLGSDVSGGVTYRVPPIAIEVPAAVDSIVTHTYSDWNNDGKYECVLSLRGGKIVVAIIDNEDLDPGSAVIDLPGETLFPAVVDGDGDGRKDLLVISEGKGAYLYLNTGTDQAPAFGTPVAVAGDGSATLGGNPLLWDFDGDGMKDLVAASGDWWCFHTGSGDTTLRQLPEGEDLNAGGGRIPGAGTSCALLILSGGNNPRLALLNDGVVGIYPLRLLGDVTGDGTVNISDISRIAKAWELTSEDPGWNPACNLRLSASGSSEVIDIKDISRAAKNWELTE